jgi:hypothetical protein
LPSLAPFCQAVSEEKIFLTVTNQKKELLLAAMFVPFFFSDWLLLNKSSPLKLLGQMEPNLPGSIFIWCHLSNKYGHKEQFFFLEESL